jgi:hypothetical protein
MGIKTVISLRDSGSDYHDLTGTGLRYLPLYFNPAHPEEKNVFAFFKAASDPQNQPVFVHCCFGKDRTGMMVAVYRMATQDRSRGEAISEMKAMGFHSIWQQIDGYVKHMDIQRVKTQFASAPRRRSKPFPDDTAPVAALIIVRFQPLLQNRQSNNFRETPWSQGDADGTPDPCE